jgi:hypothetical protein
MRTPLRLGSASLLLASITLVAVACNTNADDVCENVGACSQGGSSEWVKSCQDEAKSLRDAAGASGCRAPYDTYYRCANDNFDCVGATATFPGCDGARMTLDACLTNASANNACGELARKTRSCATADASAAPAPATACTSSRECAARCFLDGVADACAPRPDELEAVGSCVGTCPP